MTSRSLVALVCLLAVGCDTADGSDAGRAVDAAVPGGDGSFPDAGPADGGLGDDGGLGVDAGPTIVPGPRYVGRHDASDPGAVRLSWSGSGLILRFRGTGARVSMNGAGRFFTVIVDGSVQPTLAVSGASGTYSLAADLPDGEHTVELYRRTEGSFGPTVVHGLEVDGELLAVPEPTRQLEVVGDSISAGYGVDGPDRFCDFSAETENHFLTYGAVAARALGAELSTVAWSGKGAVHNYGDDRNEPMPELYGRVIATDAASTGVIRPADAVVVNLGTNDFSTDGDPTDAEFVPAYVNLLEQIRSRHPDALIACTVGPPLGTSDQTRARGGIEMAIAQRNMAGDARVTWVDLDGFSDWGCDWHPGDETQALLAEDLVAFLRSELGW